MLQTRPFATFALLLSAFGMAGCKTTAVAPPAPLAVLPAADPVAASPALIPLDPRPVAEGDVNAAQMSYTYVEVGATQLDVDAAVTGARDADTYYGRVSLGLGILLHGFASYENTEFNLNGTTSDLFKLGAGAHLEVSDKLHAVGEIAWLFNDVSSNVVGFGNSKFGYEMKAGVRFMALEFDRGGVELDGNLVWVDLDNRLASEDRAFGWEAGARLHLFKLLSVGAMYSILEDDDLVSVSARVAF